MFAVKISPYFKKLCDTYPILRKMVEFDKRENDLPDLELSAPDSDHVKNNQVSNIAIHRYPDRVLIFTTMQCASHCRFCFRKSMVGSHALAARGAVSLIDELPQLIEYIRKAPGVKEVVLSGGDTLTVEPDILAWFLKNIKQIRTLRTIRVHTRAPVYDPERVYSYKDALSHVDTIVVHVNHPYEITDDFKKAVAFLRKYAIVCNQSVLLKGINDSAETLSDLSYKLVQAGVIPYYLHYLDLAPGVSHFRTPLKKSIKMVQNLRGRLPGYMIPRLVLDIPGGKGKIVLEKQMYRFISHTEIMVRSPLDGKEYYYREQL